MAFKAAELVPATPGNLEDVQALSTALSMPELACAYAREQVGSIYY